MFIYDAEKRVQRWGTKFATNWVQTTNPVIWKSLLQILLQILLQNLVANFVANLVANYFHSNVFRLGGIKHHVSLIYWGLRPVAQRSASAGRNHPVAPKGEKSRNTINLSNINLDNLSLNFYTTSTFYLVRQLGMVQRRYRLTIQTDCTRQGYVQKLCPG